MKWKKQSGSISAKLFYIYMVLFLVTGIVLFSSFFLRFEHIYRQQADSHMADITDMSAENIRNMEEQIDQFSVSVLTDRVVQENLKIINEKMLFQMPCPRKGVFLITRRKSPSRSEEMFLIWRASFPSESTPEKEAKFLSEQPTVSIWSIL